MRLLVWGSGAIGGTLGAFFAHHGHEITLVDTVSEHVDAINAHGLEIRGPIAAFTQLIPACTPETVEGEWDTIILATKAHHTEAAVRALRPHLSQRGYVVSAQNGLNEYGIAKIVGAERTMGAFVNFGADYLGPGIIHYGGRAANVLGEIDGRLTPRLHELHRTWKEFEENTIITTNIFGYLWGKQAYGAMLFATALTNESIADALAMPQYRPVYIALAREILAVAAAVGVTPEGFDGFSPAAYLPSSGTDAADTSLDGLVAHNRRSAKTHSGIWRDIAVRKRRTEVDAQLGIVVTLGAEHHVPTPTLSRLVALIHDVEAGAREQSLNTLNLLAADVPATGNTT